MRKSFEVAGGISLALSGKVSDEVWGAIADTPMEADLARWKHASQQQH